MSKIAVLGGAGVRTPFLIYGLNEAARALGVREVALYDLDIERAHLMAALGNAVINRHGRQITVSVCETLERAVADASFVINSIRAGGMQRRADAERIVMAHGLAGQETTGPGGLAMALRTIPIVLEYAKTIERVAPEAWFVNFTNPAGLITQAVTTHSGLRSVGICDTPRELFHRVAEAIGGSLDSVVCDYFGLNHLGWIRSVRHNGRDVTAKLLSSDEKLKSLYSADLFDPALIRGLGLIPTEYLFFCYSQKRALANQTTLGVTRGQEVLADTNDLFMNLQRALKAGQDDVAVEHFAHYHQRRIGSYMKLEASAGSLLDSGSRDPNDPFTSATGYHRIAIDVMTALRSDTPHSLVVNTPNRGAIRDLREDDVVEVPCQVSRNGVAPMAIGSLPDSVRGLVISVKEYERLAVQAAVNRSLATARLALLTYPIVGQWELATTVLEALAQNDSEFLGAFQARSVP